MENQFDGVVQASGETLWNIHIPVPSSIANSFLGEEGNRRVVATYNGSKEIQCALFPDGKGNWFLSVSKNVRKVSRIEIGDKVSVTLKKDESEYGLPLPEELAELWAIDDEGKRVFHLLTKGKQRSLLHIVGKPKTSETRVKKAIIMNDYLKSTGGKLDFTELQEAFKNRKNEF